MRRGWFRLWIVASAVFVPGLATWLYNDQTQFWLKYNKSWTDTCDKVQVYPSPPFPSLDKCLHQFGADQWPWQHVHLGTQYGWALLADLVLTALLVGAFFITRWIVRGFTAGSGAGIEEWWGRTFEKRGTANPLQLPDKNPKTMRGLATEDVAELYRSEGAHDHPTVGGILAGMELRRRENWTGRAALVVSILALVIAFASALLKA